MALTAPKASGTSLPRVLFAGLVLVAALAPQAHAQTTYVAYGDSITAGTGDPGGTGYPGRLETLLPGDTVLNRGLEGGTTVTMLEEFSATVSSSGADVMLLMVGTNDVSKVARGAEDAIPIETAIRNIAVLVNRASNNGMSTTHATVIPRYPGARSDTGNEVTGQFNGELRNQAGVNGRRLVDVNDRFLQEPRWNALYIADRPGDPVGHPNAAGYDEIADAFADVINGVDSARPAPGVLSPLDGERRVSRNSQVRVDLWDFGTGIDPDSVEVRVNGALAQSAPITSGKRVTVNYSPANRFSGRVDVHVRAQDQSSPPLEIDRVVATFFTRPITFPDGDVNRDGRVDGLDLLILGAAFGGESDSSRWDPDADLDRDGDVDGTDLAILVENFGNSI